MMQGENVEILAPFLFSAVINICRISMQENLQTMLFVNVIVESWICLLLTDLSNISIWLLIGLIKKDY